RPSASAPVRRPGARAPAGGEWTRDRRAPLRRRRACPTARRALPRSGGGVSATSTRPRVFCVIADEHRDVAVAEDACAGRFTHCGVTLDLGRVPDWSSAGLVDDPEWRVECSKFLWALDLAHAHATTGERRFCDAWERLARSWIEQVPPRSDATEVAARRLQNWVYAREAFGPSASLDGLLHARLRDEVDYVREHLTHARNHRTLELYGLLVAALGVAEVDEDGSLAEFALAQLEANLEADFHPDGVHCEQSTHYHALVVRSHLAALENAQRFGLPVGPEYEARLARACEFLRHVRRPDGGLPQLSDSDGADPAKLLALGARLLRRPDLHPPSATADTGTTTRFRSRSPRTADRSSSTRAATRTRWESPTCDTGSSPPPRTPPSRSTVATRHRIRAAGRKGLSQPPAPACEPARLASTCCAERRAAPRTRPSMRGRSSSWTMRGGSCRTASRARSRTSTTCASSSLRPTPTSSARASSRPASCWRSPARTASRSRPAGLRRATASDCRLPSSPLGTAVATLSSRRSSPRCTRPTSRRGSLRGTSAAPTSSSAAVPRRSRGRSSHEHGRDGPRAGSRVPAARRAARCRKPARTARSEARSSRGRVRAPAGDVPPRTKPACAAARRGRRGDVPRLGPHGAGRSRESLRRGTAGGDLP